MLFRLLLLLMVMLHLVLLLLLLGRSGLLRPPQVTNFRIHCAQTIFSRFEVSPQLHRFQLQFVTPPPLPSRSLSFFLSFSFSIRVSRTLWTSWNELHQDNKNNDIMWYCTEEMSTNQYTTYPFFSQFISLSFFTELDAELFEEDNEDEVNSVNCCCCLMVS